MDFDNSFLDSVLEGAEEAIDITLDAVQEQEAEFEDTAATDVDDVEIDSIIGDDGKGSSALISDDDIEKIDAGKDPDFDMVDSDAAKGAKDKEIDELQKDAEDSSIITKGEIKNLKEGYDLFDFVGDAIDEDFALPDSGEDIDNDCPVCHCTPCICKERVNTLSVVNADADQPQLFRNHVDEEDTVVHQMMSNDVKNSQDNQFVMGLPTRVEERDLFDNTNQDLTGIESDDEVHGNAHFASSEEDDDVVTDMDDDMFDVEDSPAVKSATPGYNPYDDNEPAGPIQPLNDCREQNQYGFTFENHNEEGDINMFDDDDLDLDTEDTSVEMSYDDSDMETASSYYLDESAEDDFADEDSEFLMESSDDDAEDIMGEMDDLDNVEMFNSFEGSGINTKQYGEDDFLLGMSKNVDEPSGSFTSIDSLKFSQVDTRPFGKADDPSIADMIK